MEFRKEEEREGLLGRTAEIEGGVANRPDWRPQNMLVEPTVGTMFAHGDRQDVNWQPMWALLSGLSGGYLAGRC